MPPTFAIDAHNLAKAYPLYASQRERLRGFIFGPARAHWALRNLSLQVRPGETIGIIGRNGSGKSTLLQLLCGILQPSEGHLHTTGRIAALLELGAGFNPDFTGRENVHLNARLLGLHREEIDARMPGIAAFAEIGAAFDRPVKMYSSGMVVRLAFAVLAHVDADMLLIDEALAVGDAAFVRKCFRFLHAFRRGDPNHARPPGTLVFVSHDPAAILQLCDRVVWLDAGQVRRIGPAKETCEAYLETVIRAAAPDTDATDHTPPPLPADTAPTPGEFGIGGAEVRRLTLCHANGRSIATVAGGENVTLFVGVRAHRAIASPIVGFFVKDRLGQQLFGENTHGIPDTANNPAAPMPPGEHRTIRFSFTMPVLPRGAYSIDAALADGTPEEHRMLHWVRDGLSFESTATQPHRGLVGIPIQVSANPEPREIH